MNDQQKKAGSYGVVAAAGLAAGALLTPSHTVKYEMPPEAVRVYEDAKGTDGSDPSKVDVIFTLNGKEVRIRKDQLK